METLKPIQSFDISAGGHGKGLLGDLDGDGNLELLIVRADGDIDDRYVPHTVTCLTAYKLDGSVLWQRGQTEGKPGNFGSDFPAQICDINGDGQNEVLAVMHGEFLVLSGEDGSILETHPLPDPDAHDCIIICNLTGGRNDDIILKDRYRRLWAFDRDWNLLWTHEGNVGHFPWPFDLNGDGYDEVMAGYDLLDRHGNVLWSCKDLSDHADCLWTGDVNGDGKPEIIVGGSCTCLYDAGGHELWRYDGSIESQHVALGHFLPDLPGLQVAGLDRIQRGDGYKGQWDGKDGMFLLDCDGKERWKEERKTKGWLTIVDACTGFGTDSRDYILAYRRGGGVLPGLYDGNGEPVYFFDHEGYVVHGDLYGRGSEDVLVYDGTKAYIYSTAAPDSNGTPERREQPLRLMRSTLYPGGNCEN